MAPVTTNQVAISQFLFQQKPPYLAPQLQLTQQALEALAGTWAKALPGESHGVFSDFSVLQKDGKSILDEEVSSRVSKRF